MNEILITTLCTSKWLVSLCQTRTTTVSLQHTSELSLNTTWKSNRSPHLMFANQRNTCIQLQRLVLPLHPLFVKPTPPYISPLLTFHCSSVRKTLPQGSLHLYAEQSQKFKVHLSVNSSWELLSSRQQVFIIVPYEKSRLSVCVSYHIVFVVHIRNSVLRKYM